MQHKYYAQALFELIKQNPENYKGYLDSLRNLLKKKSQEKLWPRVIREFKKLLDKYEARFSSIVIFNEKDLQKAKDKASSLGVHEYKVVKKPNIIGGYVIKTAKFVYDASYRKYLLDLYEKLKS